MSAKHGARRETGQDGMVKLGDLLGDACESGMGESGVGTPEARVVLSKDLAKRVALLWPEIVGDEVAVNSRPLRFRRGRLSASAASAAWAQTLQFLAGSIAGRLNEALGDDVIKEVVFHHAGWEEDPVTDTSGGARDTCGTMSPGAESVLGTGGLLDPMDESPEAVGHDSSVRSLLSPEQVHALDEVEALDLDPELKRRIVSAMRLAFVRGQQDSVR